MLFRKLEGYFQMMVNKRLGYLPEACVCKHFLQHSEAKIPIESPASSISCLADRLTLFKSR